MKQVAPVLIVVLDTSTIIKGLLSKGNTSSNSILLMGQEKKLVFAYSPETFTELSKTIQKSYIKSNISPQKVARFIAWYKYNGLPAKITNHQLVSRDSMDDKFLNLALSVKAKVIISEDKDLLVLKKYKNIPIMTGEEFITNGYAKLKSSIS